MPELDDFCAMLSPAMLLTVTLIGLVVGAIYLAQRHTAPINPPLQLFVAGEAFSIPLTVTRWLDGTAPARQAGLSVLWVLFCVAVWVGIKLRSKTFKAGAKGMQ
jgi:hypothetical protein